MLENCMCHLFVNKFWGVPSGSVEEAPCRTFYSSPMELSPIEEYYEI